MRKRNETRKFKKIRKGSKNYSTHRNKSGGTLGTFARSLTSDGRLLEEFKTKIRNVLEFQLLLDDVNNSMPEKTRGLTHAANNTIVNTTPAYKTLKTFVDNNKQNLKRILGSNMTIQKKEFYNQVLAEVSINRVGNAVVGDYSMNPNTSSSLPLSPPSPPAPPTADADDDMSDKGAGVGDKGDADTGDVIENITIDDAKVYKITNRRCPTDTDEGKPRYFTCDYVTEGQEITDVARCKFCFKSKREHIQQGQGGGSRRRRRTTRKNKTRRNGKCRACKCPGGCKRSTCPCYRGRSKPCCTKRCRSRGRVCRC